jgi:hypothetical protein
MLWHSFQIIIYINNVLNNLLDICIFKRLAQFKSILAFNNYSLILLGIWHTRPKQYYREWDRSEDPCSLVVEINNKKWITNFKQTYKHIAKS